MRVSLFLLPHIPLIALKKHLPMLDNISLRDMVFIDIETVSARPTFDNIVEEEQKLWEYRIHRYKPDDTELSDYYHEKAAVYAEFGKAICISVGFFAAADEKDGKGEYQFRIKTFSGHDEKNDVLQPFNELLDKYFSPERYYLCGHNIREFDIPFLCRRSIINNLKIPRLMDIIDLKPWEVKHLDTMHIWRFGEYRNMTSLHLICKVLGIETPKNDMEGKDVGRVYWQENDINRIARYNRADVVAVAQIILRFKRLPLIDTANQVVWADREG